LLGKGRYGQVFKGIKVDEQKEVAIKYGIDEDANSKEEFEIHKELSMKEKAWDIGIPKIYDYYSVEEDEEYLMMELLGENLENLFILNGRKI